MTDDIVARLRVLNHHAKKLAENESLHDLHRDALTRCENMTWEAADEIERLREELTASHESHGNEVGALTERLSLAIHERDDARREICLLRASSTNATDKVSAEMEEYARSRGWENLFGEDSP